MSSQLLARLERDRAEAVHWATALLAADDWVVLDTETTGVDYGCVPVSVAIIAHTGAVLLDTLCMPAEGVIPSGAVAIHGLTEEILRARNAPPFHEVWPRICRAVAGKRIVAYNSSFDSMILRYACLVTDETWLETAEWIDAMAWYSQWVGEWSTYHRDYRYQRLPRGEGLHGAVGDCLMTLDLIRKMAAE